MKMKKLFTIELLVTFILLAVFIHMVYAGGFWTTSPTWGKEVGSVSDTLITTGADTSSYWKLQVQTGTGRSYDCANEVVLLVQMRETADTDSGRLLVYLEVSNDGTTWYPYNSETVMVDTIKSDGTSAQTKSWTASVTTFNEAKYMRSRIISIMPDDSAWVSKFVVNCKY